MNILVANSPRRSQTLRLEQLANRGSEHVSYGEFIEYQSGTGVQRALRGTIGHPLPCVALQPARRLPWTDTMIDHDTQWRLGMESELVHEQHERVDLRLRHREPLLNVTAHGPPRGYERAVAQASGTQGFAQQRHLRGADGIASRQNTGDIHRDSRIPKKPNSP